MATMKRHKTKYPGVVFVEGKAVSTGKPERIYYIRYRKDGKQIEEKAGRQFQDDMTPARAATLRTSRIEGQPSNKERRDAERTTKDAESDQWTIQRLYEAYFESRPENKAKSIDRGRYEKYLKADFGTKEPQELLPLDVDRTRVKLLKKVSPQTVKHVLNLLTWIINFGIKQGFCPGLSFHVRKPTVNNEKTEFLTDEELARLMEAIEKSSNRQVASMMKLALYSGMRRGEMFKLQWRDVDFETGFITLKDPKGGIDAKIPMSDTAREILLALPKDSPFVFPGKDGGQRVTAAAAVNKIKKAAGLPKDFRPLHGLRHHFASMAASSGRVDMYLLQRLLTHKDGRMTQRYAHLADSALKSATNEISGIVSRAGKKQDNDEVIPLLGK